MPELTAFDEQFVHQIPEPLPQVVQRNEHWRESLFFVLHPPEGLGDVVILTMATYPARGAMDSLQLGRIGGEPAIGYHHRAYEGDPHTMRVGPVAIDIAEPFRRVQLHVDDAPTAPISYDLEFTARTRAYGLRRGTMKFGDDTIWDQSHMIQSGRYNGTIRKGSENIEIRDWWGQRDHSWGIRDHARCPMWTWWAIQLPEGMLGVWHWELTNGARVFTDGCFAPEGDAAPIPVVDFRHELRWIDADGKPVDYGRDGDDVDGVNGTGEFVLEGGRAITIEVDGRWAQRYGPVGGGLNEVTVRSSEGSSGTGIVEVTGAHHHKYFPVARP